MDMIGASAYTWEIQHMLGHHPYTNLLDVVEEERKGRNVDCKIEEKDQVRRERVCDLSCVRYLFDGSNVLTSYPRSICH